tara:strand:+ start:228 stop:581 length:354 start_codon:yes stop_codon:yes gene_type:complete
VAFEISKTYTFEAAHSLPFLPESHKCHHLHGHSYKITIKVRGDALNSQHMVTDFAELDACMAPLVDRLDHQNLNNHFPCTTSEYLAKAIFQLIGNDLPGLFEVGVKETEKTGAKYCA